MSQLNQYELNVSWDWKNEGTDIISFIENTLKLIMASESSISSKFLMPTYQCKKEQNVDKALNKMIFKVDFDEMKVFTMKEIIEKALLQQSCPCECCHNTTSLQNCKDKCLIVQISRPCKN